ncbi:hypothetical protein EY643_08855 [Halioglobus maricola]|uniref:Sulfatase N-terminal domain-containing protein n=1 Tax=Halioglobus maricola TaxID=2601894 RepID=A0A5P9NJS7_9GAMM|nr:sulfatase [Halioglobus maricola]QFU75756.1 hypothetical protein EY643_08855 [Halioglobus maricola]
MPMISHILKSIATVILLLVLLIVFFAVYRYLSFGQTDNADRVASKEEYLSRIKNMPLPVDAPNILFILYDDMGYGDLGAGKAATSSIQTPNLDALAEAGVVLSDFYSPAAVCTPARAGYLTGRLAPRAGLPNVVFPSGSPEEFMLSKVMNPDINVRLPEEEITLAELVLAAGYRTAMVGKWHLGDVSPSLPNDRGFQEFFGSRYSNDMEPFALYRDEEIEIPAPADQRRLTEWYTREAVAFVEADEQPFFLYFAHNFPHDPLYASVERSGNSSAGLYGDVLEEIDDGIGKIVASLRSTGKLKNTLIIITSDNGPWFQGSAGGRRGRKGNTFEGGMRVPFIAHWPAAIPPGRAERTMTMGVDLLPTVLDILQLPAPADRALDGCSLLPALVEGGASAHEYLYFIDGQQLFAVRDQRFKYRGPEGVFYSTDQMKIGFAMPQKEWLFDLDLDPQESYDVSARYPEVLARLREAFELKREAMLANARGWDEKGNCRPPAI